MITLKELSVKCGVSIATISNVINGKSNVSEETKNRILKAIKDSGYQPNYMARSLRSQKSKTVGLIIEDITSFSSPQLIEGIMACCEANGYRCVLENLRFYTKMIDAKPAQYQSAMFLAVQQMNAIKVDGIICVAAHGRELNFFPDDLDIPGVVAYAKSASSKYPSVLIADEKAAFEMTEYMIKKGRKKIGFVSGEKDNFHSIRRYQGYCRALKENKISLDEAVVFFGQWDRATGYKSAELFLKKGIDAVFCTNDNMAAGFCDFLIKKNVKIGEQILVAGFDGRDLASYTRPKLTTQKIPLYAIGYEAGQLILSQINGMPVDKSEITVDCEIDIGESA